MNCNWLAAFRRVGTVGQRTPTEVRRFLSQNELLCCGQPNTRNCVLNTGQRWHEKRKQTQSSSGRIVFDFPIDRLSINRDLTDSSSAFYGETVQLAKTLVNWLRRRALHFSQRADHDRDKSGRWFAVAVIAISTLLFGVVAALSSHLTGLGSEDVIKPRLQVSESQDSCSSQSNVFGLLPSGAQFAADWRLHVDRKVGFEVRFPKDWVFDSPAYGGWRYPNDSAADSPVVVGLSPTDPHGDWLLTISHHNLTIYEVIELRKGQRLAHLCTVQTIDVPNKNDVVFVRWSTGENEAFIQSAEELLTLEVSWSSSLQAAVVKQILASIVFQTVSN